MALRTGRCIDELELAGAHQLQPRTAVELEEVRLEGVAGLRYGDPARAPKCRT